jgi:hypothetical protein
MPHINTKYQINKITTMGMLIWIHWLTACFLDKAMPEQFEPRRFPVSVMILNAEKVAVQLV